eukprot:TRINITY_DN24045_c0_g1_i1.p1 TRINITY_DN24045_c0_g1~~TRINITY_DN24045_c0_g1_i1.p1  ORF type:complete len:441 (-),score=49.56 TRINITY_DN24045_c0_g1_i1:278-1600(-)
MTDDVRFQCSSDVSFASVSLRGSKFDIPKHFTVLNVIGQGAYSVVCSAKEEGKKGEVAIKKIENPFEERIFAVRVLRELVIMRNMQHDNLLGLQSMFVSGSKSSFQDVYVVCELMETDLATILKSPQSLSADHCIFFQYQILRGLKYLHSANVIHRDLKPRNLLVNSDCELKICDYGLARVYPLHAHPSPLTGYVSTRWYRAPELLCSRVYDKAVDMWSAGCIFAEILTREVLFPGRSAQNQLQLILKCLGTPKRDILAKVANKECRTFIESLPWTSGKSWNTVINQPHADKLAIEVLDRLLRFAPDQRATASEALQLEYFALLHCPEDEPTRSPLKREDFAFEMSDELDLSALRDAIWLEAMRSPRRTSKKRPAEAWVDAKAELGAVHDGEATTGTSSPAKVSTDTTTEDEADAEAILEEQGTASWAPPSPVRSRLLGP